MDPTGEGSVVVSRRTRGCVYAFLLVFAITGFAHLELFPFSGFRLFSEVRTAERHSWQLRAVDDDGNETAVPLSTLPRGDRHTTARLEEFADLSAASRDETCDEWAESVRAGGVEVSSVRVYYVAVDVRPDAPPPRRTLTYECGGQT